MEQSEQWAWWLVDLGLVIMTISAWDRPAIGFRAEPGKYVSQLKPTT